jgi:hypothetical protein
MPIQKQQAKLQFFIFLERRQEDKAMNRVAASIP